eukprot:753265-Hanusia_phi.AAC.1
MARTFVLCYNNPPLPLPSPCFVFLVVGAQLQVVRRPRRRGKAAAGAAQKGASGSASKRQEEEKEVEERGGERSGLDLHERLRAAKDVDEHGVEFLL